MKIILIIVLTGFILLLGDFISKEGNTNSPPSPESYRRKHKK